MTVLQEALGDPKSTAHVLLYADAHQAWKNAQQKLRRLEQHLGVTDATMLQKLRHSEYYAARMNTKVLKERLRQRLRERKFELDLIERSFRRSRSENQRNDHAGAAIKRREPTINNTVKEYNKLCADISTLIKAKKAPGGAVAPTPIPAKGIYQLDVDDVIWQDLGLDDDTTPELWLVDAKVRAGIRAMLQKDRCEEEAPRLQRERRHMQQWFAIEWDAVSQLIDMSQGALRYQFELRREELLQLCVLWRKSLDALPYAGDLPPWGPTDQEILDCQISGVTASYGNGDDSDNERTDEDEGEDGEDEDDDLLYVLEAVERADIHRRGDVDEAEWTTLPQFFRATAATGQQVCVLATPSPATPSPATPSPATPSPATPSPATPSPATPSPATPSPATPSPSTPSPATPSPATTPPGFYAASAEVKEDKCTAGGVIKSRETARLPLLPSWCRVARTSRDDEGATLSSKEDDAERRDAQPAPSASSSPTRLPDDEGRDAQAAPSVSSSPTACRLAWTCLRPDWTTTGVKLRALEKRKAEYAEAVERAEKRRRTAYE
ncbi:hypothetical protein B0H12DRAFT_1240761 [Mycena haematopus]|nr:hypothetical protein B0H12DRAFT_1240761 [Mycena haematopus]